ncbi:YopX family protein [Parabacteroides johnsonii]|uniref:YopX family protein n=1 Tax=Parabacteroides johnsonii TaxID=387661 RepID=UPI00242C2D12|nr:YopX family protein [Parabacteroides johnsonii]
MRTIKFRGKSLHTNHWHCGDLIQPSDNVCFIQQRGMAGFLCDIKTVGQFTGLQDKNGEDIYEGDIINIQVISSHTKDVIINEKCSVVFYNGCFGMAEYGMRKEFVRFDSFVEYLTSFEIVGNIYDNPELLTQS